MKENLKAENTVIIHAPLASVWDLITNPEKIKIFMFGSEVHTDWIPGSPVLFSRGEITDKGRIIQFLKNAILQFTYWSSMEGYADIPENYSLITYRLKKITPDETQLQFIREHIPIAFEQQNQQRYLPGMMTKIKELAEH